MSEQRCTECAHAYWKRTAKGMLHQSGDGTCNVEIAPLPTLAKCMSWAITPRRVGGWINRRRANYSDCPLFAPNEERKP